MLFVCICRLPLFVCRYFMHALCVCRPVHVYEFVTKAELSVLCLSRVLVVSGEFVFAVGSCSRCVRGHVVIVIVMRSRYRELVLVTVLS